MQRKLPDDLVSDKPSSRGPESLPNDFQAKTFRQVVKRCRGVGKEARAHAWSKPRLRMPDLLPPRARLTCGLAVELQFAPASDQLHLGARLLQESSQIQRGSSAADHDDAATAKRFDFAMAGTVGEKLGR